MEKELQLLIEKLQKLSNKKAFLVKTNIFKESLNSAKQKYLINNLIEEDIFKKLLESDKTSSKKYIEWMCKIYLKDQPELHELKNAIEEFNALVLDKRIKGEESNIEKYKSFKEFSEYIDRKNNEEIVVSKTQQENDYKILINNSELFVVAPHNHAASRKVGLKWFAVRPNTKTGTNDCPWCTTYGAESHWKGYWESGLDSFYYVKVKGKLKEKIISTPGLGPKCEYVALQIHITGGIRVWNTDDSQISKGGEYMRILEEYLEENNLIESFWE